ncbi:hypothetical protein, partial [Sulfobacillus harzensis]|nr:hypothetical protein [Sulfobacillus harzensis]
FSARVMRVLGADRFILEGNYHDRFLEERLRRADAIVYFDVSTVTAVHGIISRTIKRLSGDKSSLPSEIANDASYVPRLDLKLSFLVKAVLFKLKVRPVMMQKFQEVKHSKMIVVLKSRRQGENLLRALADACERKVTN